MAAPREITKSEKPRPPDRTAASATPPLGPPPGGPADRAKCLAPAADADGKRARYEACRASCESNAYEHCEAFADLAAELQIGVAPESAAMTALRGWSQGCLGAKSATSCTKRDAALARIRGACTKPVSKAIAACLEYGDALSWAPWNAAVKAEQEDLFERLCFLDSTTACDKFAGLTMNMEAPLRVRAHKALEHGCALGAGSQCCEIAVGHDPPMPVFGADPAAADAYEAKAKKAGYAQCGADRATRAQMSRPPIIE
jgi:hypothetical protein